MHLPDSSTPTILSPLLNHATSDPTCGFEGNDDIYGIGIRIGVYSQLIAVWFSNYFLLSEVQVLRDSVTIFSVAILIVAFIFASNPSEVYAVEAFVLLMILAWGCLMGVCPNSSYSKAVFSRGSLLRMVVCEIVNLMNIALQVWFWWTGLDYMKKTPCGTWLMMYVVKTNLFGWARKVMMAMNVGVLVCTVYWGTVDFVRLWAAWKIKDKRGEFETAIREWEDAQKVGADSDIQEKDSAQDGISDVGDQTSSHSSCSKASCTYCSPTRTDFGLDLLNATHMPPEPLRQGPPQSNRSSWVTAQEASKRSSLITTQEISPPPTRSNSPTSFHEESETAAPNSTSTILHEVHEAEIYIQHCITASPYQLGTDGKPLTFSVIARFILYPKKYRTAEQGKPPPPSWLHCQFYSWAAFLTCRFPPQAFVIYSHLRQSFLLDPLNGPFQTYASITAQSLSKMASQQPSPPQLQSPSPPLPHSTTPSKPLDKNTKTQGKPLQEIQSTSYHPISPSTTNTILTITFLALITILSIIHLIHQSTANVFEISNIFLLSPILSIISIAALLWRKYKSWRVRRMILDEEEEAVGWMDEDETLEEGGELYAVGWEDGSRDSKGGNGGDLGR
ncbi:beta-ketoacyl synthase [Stemphylium lycopersici]|nr:beta-ketoacyl synthase [Stemphylium lycopersici]